MKTGIEHMPSFGPFRCRYCCGHIPKGTPITVIWQEGRANVFHKSCPITNRREAEKGQR